MAGDSPPRRAARLAVSGFIEGWSRYAGDPRHSALGYESPLRYERIHAAGALRTTAPETSAAALPVQATIAQGGAISLSPQTGPTTGPTNRGRG